MTTYDYIGLGIILAIFLLTSVWACYLVKYNDIKDSDRVFGLVMYVKKRGRLYGTILEKQMTGSEAKKLIMKMQIECSTWKTHIYAARRNYKAPRDTRSFIYCKEPEEWIKEVRNIQSEYLLHGMPRNYVKPDINNLRGRTAREIVEKIKRHTVPSDDNIRREAEECKEKMIQKRKKHEKQAD